MQKIDVTVEYPKVTYFVNYWDSYPLINRVDSIITHEKHFDFLYTGDPEDDHDLHLEILSQFKKFFGPVTFEDTIDLNGYSPTYDPGFTTYINMTDAYGIKGHPPVEHLIEFTYEVSEAHESYKLLKWQWPNFFNQSKPTTYLVDCYNVAMGRI